MVLASSSTTCTASIKKLLPAPYWNQQRQKRAVEIIMAASDNLSRTISEGRRFMAPDDLEAQQISQIAQKNFERTARYLVKNHGKLELNQKTAIRLNKMLTKDLVPDPVRGRMDFRRRSPSRELTDDFVDGQFYLFYKWLEGEKASDLLKTDPVKLAELIHHNISALDSFPDGNGRLARLMADLALIKADLAPALYTGIEDYFARGNALSGASREALLDYFREMAQRGQDAMISI